MLHTFLQFRIWLEAWPNGRMAALSTPFILCNTWQKLFLRIHSCFHKLIKQGFRHCYDVIVELIEIVGIRTMKQQQQHQQNRSLSSKCIRLWFSTSLFFLVVTYNCYIKRQMQRGHLKQKESKKVREKGQHILRAYISTRTGDFNIPANWNGLPPYSKWFSKCNCCCCCFDAISECF